jgi:DNA-binding NarL/FixJ family response regulator
MPRPKREDCTLTTREQQILALYMQGMKYKAIAAMLRIEFGTVSSTLDRCQLDLGLENRRQLQAYARFHGLDVVQEVAS